MNVILSFWYLVFRGLLCLSQHDFSGKGSYSSTDMLYTLVRLITLPLYICCVIRGWQTCLSSYITPVQFPAAFKYSVNLKLWQCSNCASLMDFIFFVERSRYLLKMCTSFYKFQMMMGMKLSSLKEYPKDGGKTRLISCVVFISCNVFPLLF